MSDVEKSPAPKPEAAAPAPAPASPSAPDAQGQAPSDRPAGASAPASPESKDRGFAELVKRIALGAAEAVHVSPDDLKGFVTRLVEKGELAQQDGKRIVQEFGERLRRVVREPVTSARGAAEEASGAIKTLADKLARREPPTEDQVGALIERVNASVERVLGAMHIATAKQVEGLRDKIDTLDKRLAEIAERLGVTEAAGV
jgi:polyhydroxyalkanoate synthesis regulator phasin